MTRAEYNIGVGRRLRDRREALKLRQDQLAILLDVSSSSVSNWENGRSTMNAFARQCVSDLFSKTPQEIQKRLARVAA